MQPRRPALPTKQGAGGWFQAGTMEKAKNEFWAKVPKWALKGILAGHQKIFSHFS